MLRLDQPLDRISSVKTRQLLWDGERTLESIRGQSLGSSQLRLPRFSHPAVSNSQIRYIGWENSQTRPYHRIRDVDVIDPGNPDLILNCKLPAAFRPDREM